MQSKTNQYVVDEIGYSGYHLLQVLRYLIAGNGYCNNEIVIHDKLKGEKGMCECVNMNSLMC